MKRRRKKGKKKKRALSAAKKKVRSSTKNSSFVFRCVFLRSRASPLVSIMSRRSPDITCHKMREKNSTKETKQRRFRISFFSSANRTSLRRRPPERATAAGRLSRPLGPKETRALYVAVDNDLVDARAQSKELKMTDAERRFGESFLFRNEGFPFSSCSFRATNEKEVLTFLSSVVDNVVDDGKHRQRVKFTMFLSRVVHSTFPVI